MDLPRTQDLYARLELRRTATLPEIKQAFRRRALDFHPDRHPDDPVAEENFKALAEAYSTLLDPSLRAAYDMKVFLAELRTGTASPFPGFPPPSPPSVPSPLETTLQKLVGTLQRHGILLTPSSLHVNGRSYNSQGSTVDTPV